MTLFCLMLSFEKKIVVVSVSPIRHFWEENYLYFYSVCLYYLHGASALKMEVCDFIFQCRKFVGVVRELPARCLVLDIWIQNEFLYFLVKE